MTQSVALAPAPYSLSPKLELDQIEHFLLDDRIKGIPGGTPPFPLGEIGRKGWSVLREDLPLPLAVVRTSALDHNGRWMRRFLARSGTAIAPHGKTTMSPQLFQRQLDDGAWGITVATVHQLQVCRSVGVGRVLLANQLVGPEAVRYVLAELEADPSFDFYCLVDSVDGVRLLTEAARAQRLHRPLQVLLEGGYRGGRAGCRDLPGALEVARAVRAAEPHLALRGVEGFEGLISGASPEVVQQGVERFLRFLIEIAAACEAEGLFAPGEVILTGGGSAFYDLTVERLTRAGLRREVRVVTRSGCYLTHDSGVYREAFQWVAKRSPDARALGEGPVAALEVWAYVQSRPEPGRAILTMGKRDCGFDAGFPVPLHWFRPAEHHRPRGLGAGYAVTGMNDQHAFLQLPSDSDLRVGDLVASGVSHPCTTFDRWQVLYLVDDHYNVTSAIRTFF